ncbi:MAG: hypothetical protein COU71_00170 [Parcubacteria group bacterium CG10_big_fil_rev_8_21_14_0_10_38_31]|nr:MAG: hypothetical protein COU71_00170 [Parcubacteria group bacterium CG10_big_fil_rev_8_21_14_0_10_38_31]
MRFLKILSIKQYSLNFNSGQAGITVVILFLFISLGIIAGASSIASKDVRTGNVFSNSKKSYFLAEDGIEDVLYRIKRGKNISSAESIITPGGQVDSVISSLIGGNKEVIATASIDGYIRKIKAVLSSSYGFEFFYGVQVGAGGLSLKNNSIVEGSVYSDGSITGQSGSIITGDAYVATKLSLFDSWTINNNETLFGKEVPVLDVAQSFTTSGSGTLAQIDFYLKKTGNPSNATVRILADDAGSPSKTEVTSVVLNASQVISTYEWVKVAIPSLPILTPSSVYWVTIDTVADPNNYWYWGKDSNKGNGNGVSKTSENWNAGVPVWNEDIGDFDYKIWFGVDGNNINGLTVYGDVHANSITNTKICGDAYYKTIDASSLTFLNNPTSPTCPLPLTLGTGFPASIDPAVETMPISHGNILAWKQDALAGGAYSDPAHCNPTNGAILGPGKFTCDLIIDNGVEVIINGPIWVEGDIILNNNVVMELDPSFGSMSSVIIADYPADTTLKGKIRTKNNISICGSAGYNSGVGECNPSGGSYLMLLSTYSDPGGEAISIENNVDGGIFYASSGEADIENNSMVKEVIAYKLELENNVTVIYESGLADLNFSAGPSGAWDIVNWREVE